MLLLVIPCITSPITYVGEADVGLADVSYSTICEAVALDIQSVLHLCGVIKDRIFNVSCS